MATRRVSILRNLEGDTSGKIWSEPSTILLTTASWRGRLWRFDEDATNATALTTRVGLYGHAEIPDDYVGSPNIICIWTSTVTTGNAVWDFDYRVVSGNDTESLNQAGNDESVTVTDAAPSVASERLEATIGSPTAGNFAANATIQWGLFADGSDAADTLAAAHLLFDLMLEYSDA